MKFNPDIIERIYMDLSVLLMSNEQVEKRPASKYQLLFFTTLTVLYVLVGTTFKHSLTWSCYRFYAHKLFPLFLMS